MANIDFITFLTRHSNGYANFLRKTGECLKSKKHNIHWKCVLSNGVKREPKDFKCINRVKMKIGNSSLRHGLIINDTLSKIKSDYVVISDVDIAMTYKNWDNEIVKVLDSGYSCFGSVNVRREREPINFPNIPFFCFKKSIMQKIDLDFTPIMKDGDIEKIIIENQEQAEKFGRVIGEKVIFNTGCKLSTSFKKLKSMGLGSVPVTSDYIQLIFKNLQEKKDMVKDKISIRELSEYHYNGNVFVTHIGRSRAKSFRSVMAKNWEDRVNRYIKTKYDIDI